MTKRVKERRARSACARAARRMGPSSDRRRTAWADRARAPRRCPGEARLGLLRFTRNDKMAVLHATDWPDGQITKNLSISSHKNKSLKLSVNSAALLARLTHERGWSRSSRT